ncbi:glycosyltransferase [Halothiobacillus neapolitanus]|uniref:Glycosyl transferase group 1 n=1 Tax=Halothiobacillus neapolitanus (strain ATCC 23641 / DSM 15147 / CIP 104769 / NCIMB 8539 / c2) TaxID=555778 RepID=D0KY27_HALNC|nr:glycosyltransferase [Halothiobacillus neapolitanus]ACX95350.1 glycosyl transferase group 1 [Halothiobacillus neapolitanus c2]TDN58336.1 rhamnosyl/mannosyltransferase [Halothiobacillus neapolitanus]
MTIRVLHFGKFAFERAGGIERHVEVLARAQAAQGADVIVLAYTLDADANSRRVDGVQIEPVFVRARFSSQPLALGLILRARQLAREKPFDIVHQHWPDPFAHLVASLIPGSPAWVVSWHSDIVKQRFLGPIYRALAPIFFCKPDAVIGATKTHMASAQIDIFADTAHRHVIPYGIDPAPFELAPSVSNSVAALRTRYAGRPIVFALGRHVYYKGFDVLIRAMSRVPAVLLLGGGGPLTPELTQLAERLSTESAGQVVFVGSIPDAELPVYYHACDIFCLPSVATTEAFGIVQTEAMLCGKPIVNTNLGTGVNEVAPQGVCALTVQPEDDEALAQALNLLIESPEYAQALGDVGRERALDHYNVERMAVDTLALYASLTGNRDH